MKYRKLRIAWSVAWGVVAVLLSCCGCGAATRRRVPYFKAPATTLDLLLKFPRWRLVGLPNRFRGGVVAQSSLTRQALTRSSNLNAEPGRLGVGMTFTPHAWKLTFPPFISGFSTCRSRGYPMASLASTFRTLLIPTTLIAILLGLAVYATRQ